VKGAARIHESSTVLALGSKGRASGEAFTLVGRVVVRSDGGGLWHEHALRFEKSKKTRWLAEARGTFTLFEEAAIVPAFDDLRAGAPIAPPWIVAERGTAERVAQFGEVAIEGPRRYRYADLSSRTGESATIDYGSTPPVTFVGRRVSLDELGLAPRKEPARFFSVPELSRPKGVDLWLDVGDEGKLDAVRFRVIGIVSRSIKVEGERYAWQEYLLHDAAEGFRWLVVSDGHWSLVETIEPGLVVETDRGATLEGETYKPLSSGKARVDWATGELPWEASIGDVTDVRDYVRAPHLLSRESTADEVTWSRGTYLSPDAVARAFGKRSLPKPVGRAPNQPRSSTASSNTKR
jgi:hypothetical protein